MKPIFLLIISFVRVNGCYFNEQCPYGLFASQTPYETARGDIRDHAKPDNCEAVSLWIVGRHGNKNPSTRATVALREIAHIKDEIIASYNAGTSKLCAQDIENFKKWKWNSTLDTSESYLTGTGYEETYDMGKRIREKYAHLFNGTPDQFYMRPTNVQRTVTSCIAFAHALTEGTDLKVTVEDPWAVDDITIPYINCKRYLQEVKGGASLAHELDTLVKSPEYVAVQQGVQQRLGISTRLTADNILSIYELCRVWRTWTANFQSPWCAVFTKEDLIVLEYYDDVKHYHRNGYGSWVNISLGKTLLKDLYESFEAVVTGGGKKMIGYFTHKTMMEMAFCALGLYSDDDNIKGAVRDPNRVWRTSYISAYLANIIAVLNSCTESGRQKYRVQLFINEMESPICPAEGCSWEEFHDKFYPYTSVNLTFCSMDNN